MDSFTTSKYPNFDFLHGLQGIIYYLLYRNSDRYDFIEFYLDLLTKHAEEDEDGSKKWVFTNSLYGTSSYNLGLSHGIASIIILLSKIIKRGIYVQKSAELLRGGIQYVMKNRLDQEK